MTTRFSLNPPIAGDDTWAGRQKPSFQHDAHCADRAREWLAAGIENEQRLASEAAAAREAQIDAIWHDCPDCGAPKSVTHVLGFACEHHKCPMFEPRYTEIDTIFRTNMSRRDKAAAAYGEPESPHEFYAGRPGSKAEKIVCDCLRELQSIPETDNRYAWELTYAISKAYLQAKCSAVRMRRIAVLLRISAGEKE